MLKPSIPLVDLRGKTPVDLLRAYPDRAQGLIAASRRTFGMWSHLAAAVALPLADRRSHQWLKRSGNPYLYEIESFAGILRTPGVYALNLSYEWGCTSGAYAMEDSVSLLRVLDWPFPGMGRYVMVVRQQGKAGDFYNITWSALSGIFTAMAPGRFAAAINQAPMRRHGFSLPGDWLRNRHLAGRAQGLPPSHLLRQVFEQAGSYDEAKKMLIETPIALPVIFILTGTEPGQGCVIERLEHAAQAHPLAASRSVSASNHFHGKWEGSWQAREIDSHGRHRQSAAIGGHELAAEDFGWLQAPIINACTRLAVITDAATGRLMVQGFEGMGGVTDVFRLPAGEEQRAAV